MQTPSVSTVTSTAGKAFNWKTLLFNVILTILVTIIVSRVLRQSIVLYDKTGNVTGEGEIKPQLKWSLSKK
jgi:hypothetical protein